MGKYLKSHNNNKFKISAPRWNEEFELPDGLDHILNQIFKIILNISFKKHETVTDNPSTRIYMNKRENRITLKIKTGCYHILKLWR